MKKTSIIIGIIFSVLMISITTVRATTATAVFKPSITSVKQGDTFTVTLSATCADGINGVITTYNYDTDKLELVSHKPSEKFIDLNGESTSVIEVMISGGTVTTSDVFVLTFKVKDNATASSTATISTGDITVDSDTHGEATVEAKSTSIQITAKENSGDNTNQNTNGDNNSGSNTPINTNGDNNSGSNTPTNTNGDNNSGLNTPTNSSGINTTTNTPAKSTDTTTATSILPKTGFVATLGIALVAVFILSIVMFKKLKKYDGIK